MSETPFERFAGEQSDDVLNVLDPNGRWLTWEVTNLYPDRVAAEVIRDTPINEDFLAVVVSSIDARVRDLPDDVQPAARELVIRLVERIVEDGHATGVRATTKLVRDELEYRESYNDPEAFESVDWDPRRAER